MVESLLGNLPMLLLSVGLVLMALEAVSPGAHFIVIGVALAGAGLLGLLIPGLGGAFVLAGLTLLFGIAATYVYHEFDFYGGKGTAQTKDSSSLSGVTGYVTETVTTRSGEVKLEKGGFAPYYSARTTSGEIEEGEEVIVLDPGGGNILTVEAMGAIGEDEIDRALARGAGESADEPTEFETDGRASDSEESVTETEKSG